MSLLSRYKGHRSSLSMFIPKSYVQNHVHKVFQSYKNLPLAPLEPLDTVELQKQAESQPAGKPVDTDTLPDAGDDIPNPGMGPEETNHEDIHLDKPKDLPFNVESEEFKQIYQDYVTVCNTVCDFSSPNFDADAKEVKTNAFNSLNTFASKPDTYQKLESNNLIQEGIGSIIESHVFRTFTELPEKFLFSDDLVGITDPAMPHISLAYSLLRVCIQNETVENYSSVQFLHRLIERFCMPDPDEKGELSKTVLQWVAKPATDSEQIEERKKIAKKIICDDMSDYLCKQRSPHTIIPCLTVLKELLDLQNDKNILHDYLLPLLGAPHISNFSKELFAMIESFCDADQTLAVPCIQSLMYHWPKTRSNKLISFLNEMTSLLCKVKPREFRDLRVPVFKLYGQAACSPNYKVAEAAYGVWTKLPLEPLIMDSAKYVFPLVYYPIMKEIRTHWSSSVIEAMNSTLEAMNKIDSFVFQELCRNKNQLEEKDLVRSWANVSRAAAKHDRSLNLATKLAEIQKTFTKPITLQNNPQQQSHSQPVARSSLATEKKVVQPQVAGNIRNSRPYRF